MGLALQEGQVGSHEWQDWFGSLELADTVDWSVIQQWLVDQQVLDEDTGMLFIGPEAHRRYGGLNFRDLMAVFTADPQITILHGQQEIGLVDPMLLQRKVEGPRRSTRGGRLWKMTYSYWKRHKAFVEPSEVAGDVRWISLPQPSTYTLVNAVRRVLLGTQPAGVKLSQRAMSVLDILREEYSHRVASTGSVITSLEGSRMRWWTWAGARANAVLVSALARIDPALFETTTAFDNWQIALRGDVDSHSMLDALKQAKAQFGEDLSGVEAEADRSVPSIEVC